MAWTSIWTLCLSFLVLSISSAKFPEQDPDISVTTNFNNGTASRSKVEQVKISTRPIIIVVSFDGFRFDYFSKADTPNLNWVKNKGIFASYIRPQFPTKTFPNHHSMATGLHPETHGVVDNKAFDPLYNETLNVEDERYWVYDPNVVPLYILNEWNGGVSGVSMWPGSFYGYGHNKTKATYIVDYDKKIPFESRVDSIVSWLTNDTKPANVIFAYFEEPDTHAHVFGPDSPEVKVLIERMDNITGYLIRRLEDLKILDQVNLVFLSDHGFESVHPNNIINISSLVDPSKYIVEGTSPNYMLYPKKGEEVDALVADFKQASIGLNFSVYKKDDLPREKPHWFYSEGRRISPIILLADLGYVFEDFYFNIAHYDKHKDRGPNKTYGCHGYDNHLMHMSAFFRAVGPAFKPGLELEPFDNIDLFPLLCHMLQIETPPNNGTLKGLFKGLRPTLALGASNSNSAVGWITGFGVAIAAGILFFIYTCILRGGRWNYRDRSGSCLDNRNGIDSTDGTRNAYRFVPSMRGEGHLMDVDVNRNSDFAHPSFNFPCPEERGLLSLSEESLHSSTEQLA